MRIEDSECTENFDQTDPTTPIQHLAAQLRHALISLNQRRQQQEIQKTVATGHLLSLRSQLADKASVAGRRSHSAADAHSTLTLSPTHPRTHPPNLAVLVDASTKCASCQKPLNSTVCTLVDDQNRIHCSKCASSR